MDGEILEREREREREKERERKKERVRKELVIQGLHMVSGARCPALLLFQNSEVGAGWAPKGQCPVEHRGKLLRLSIRD